MKKIFLVMLSAMATQSVMAEDSKLPDIKEGLWELTSTAEMSGMPVAMPPMSTTTKECVSKNSLDPKALLKSQNCEITEMNIRANTATWKMNCSQQGIQMTGDGNISYQHESFSGIFNMNMQGQGGAMKIVTKTSGRYLGACQ